MRYRGQLLFCLVGIQLCIILNVGAVHVEAGFMLLLLLLLAGITGIHTSKYIEERKNDT